MHEAGRSDVEQFEPEKDCEQIVSILYCGDGACNRYTAQHPLRKKKEEVTEAGPHHTPPSEPQPRDRKTDQRGNRPDPSRTHRHTVRAPRATQSVTPAQSSLPMPNAARALVYHSSGLATASW